MKRTSTVFLILLLWSSPFLETTALGTLPGTFKGLSIFPVVIVAICLVVAQPWAAILALIGASWRDIILLTPFAPTLLGVGLLIIIFAALRRLLTNRSIVSDSLTTSLAYGGYLLGSTAAFWLARHLGIVEAQEFFAPGQAIIVLLLILLLTLVWRWRQPALLGHSSLFLP
jgi:hypothetical protein